MRNLFINFVVRDESSKIDVKASVAVVCQFGADFFKQFSEHDALYRKATIDMLKNLKVRTTKDGLVFGLIGKCHSNLSAEKFEEKKKVIEGWIDFCTSNGTIGEAYRDKALIHSRSGKNGGICLTKDAAVIDARNGR